MYDIILLKMEGCHYCDKFNPIYNRASSINKNKNLKFEMFNMSNPEEDAIFKAKYKDIANKEIDGYPTVYLKDDKNIKEIETVIVDDVKEGATKFLDNIKKTTGEQCDVDDECKILQTEYDKLLKDYENIKHKYKKYKFKYINKKNK